MFKKILVALSEKELDNITEAPVFRALSSVTLASESVVILSHVVPVNAQELERGMDEHHESELILQKKTEEVKAEFEDAINAMIQLEVTTGEPGEEVVRLANIHHADLIILGSRGLKGVNRVLGQSVSSLVIEEAACSVLVVRG